jgi:hypothetical protein
MENDFTTRAELVSEADGLLQPLEAGVKKSASSSAQIAEFDTEVEAFEKAMNATEKELAEFGQEKSKELEAMADELQREAAAEAREED